MYLVIGCCLCTTFPWLKAFTAHLWFSLLCPVWDGVFGGESIASNWHLQQQFLLVLISFYKCATYYIYPSLAELQVTHFSVIQEIKSNV